MQVKRDVSGFTIVKASSVVPAAPDEVLQQLLSFSGPYASVVPQDDSTFLLKIHDDHGRTVIYRGVTDLETNTHTLRWVD